MNIFRQFFTKSHILQKSTSFFRPLQTFVTAGRANSVPTHRGEYVDFTFNGLWDNPAAKKKKRRVGRGNGSSKGKTCGRGTKGQKARAGGGIHARFEGGQTNIARRLPKMGKRRINHERPKIINLNQIQYFVEKGRLDSSKVITQRDMFIAGVFNTACYGIKLLARGGEKLQVPLHLEVADASEEAIKLIKKAGGSVKCIYKTKLQMRELIHPEKFQFKLRDNVVPAKRIVKKYENIRQRGADVKYNVPLWQQAVLKEQEKEDKEDEVAKAKFVIPVPRGPGSGRDKVRERKPFIWKKIDYKL